MKQNVKIRKAVEIAALLLISLAVIIAYRANPFEFSTEALGYTLSMSGVIGRNAIAKMVLAFDLIAITNIVYRR